MKTIKKEVKIDINLNIDEVYESLTYGEKQDLFEEIYKDDVISVANIIDMLTPIDDNEMRNYYANDIDEIDIKKIFKQGTFNDYLISLIDKSYMMSIEEIETIKLIAMKYKYFD